MDISKIVRGSIERVYGSEAEAFDQLARQAKEGDLKALRLLLSYGYGTPVKNTEVTVNTQPTQQDIQTWADKFRKPKNGHK